MAEVAPTLPSGPSNTLGLSRVPRISISQSLRSTSIIINVDILLELICIIAVLVLLLNLSLNGSREQPSQRRIIIAPTTSPVRELFNSLLFAQMLLAQARNILSRPPLRTRIARRSYRSHEVNIFYPPSTGVARLVESESMPISRVHTPRPDDAEPHSATARRSKVRMASTCPLLQLIKMFRVHQSRT